MKWLIVLLVLLGGIVAWAALAVPTNAAVVNGSAISQASLNSDVNAIAGSAEYQCYLNAETYLSSNGSQAGLPPVTGAGKGQNEGDNPTATSAFVATYLDTVIGHELVEQLAAEHGVTTNPAQLADARSSLANQITGVMQQVAQTAQGQNPAFSCGAARPLTGEQVLASLPAWFADQQVQFVATASALQEDLAGVGSSEASLQGYFEKHRAQFDTVCFNAAEFSDQASAQAAQAAVNFGGTPFSQVVSSATQSGTIPCTELVAVAGELGTSISTLDKIAVGQASAPITVNGNYVVLELSKRTPTPYATAKQIVSQAVQEVGATATQAALTRKERRATVSVDPRYGTWVPVNARVLTPFTPETSDVLNAPANEATISTSTSPFSG